MNKYDVIVTGAGASGLMAAGKAAESGAKVLLLEKMSLPGRKLCLTGNGRCNLTNAEELDEFIRHISSNNRFLRHSFSCFFNAELIAFFKELGVKTKTEPGNKVFPASDKADDVINALTGWIKKCGVDLRTDSPVKKLIIEHNQITGVTASDKQTADERTYQANKVILAAGGASYPQTGSNGDGYKLAESAGHLIIPIRPALIPLETAGKTAQNLQGLSLNNVRVRVVIGQRKSALSCGGMLFTHFGLSGPAILSVSKTCVDALRAKEKVYLCINLYPELDENGLEKFLLDNFLLYGRQQIMTLLKKLFPERLAALCLELAGIKKDKLCNQITGTERKTMRALLKNFRLEITGCRPLSEAIITAGGINTKEVNPQTMESRLIKGLYFCGEVLDLDADTGGYNLQIAFSTGWLAGNTAGQR